MLEKGTVLLLEAIWADDLCIDLHTELLVVFQCVSAQIGIVDFDYAALVIERFEEWVFSP